MQCNRRFLKLSNGSCSLKTPTKNNSVLSRECQVACCSSSQRDEKCQKLHLCSRVHYISDRILPCLCGMNWIRSSDLRNTLEAELTCHYLLAHVHYVYTSSSVSLLKMLIVASPSRCFLNSEKNIP